ASRCPRPLRELDHVDDDESVRIDDQDRILNDDVAIPTPFRHDHHDVLGNHREMDMAGDRHADANVDLDIDLGAALVTGERLLDLGTLFATQLSGAALAGFPSALAFGRTLAGALALSRGSLRGVPI